jgi:hypothetical protein
MAFPERIAIWFRPALYLGRNPISLAGAALTTGAGFSLIAYWVFEVLLGGGARTFPYSGIIFFLILPGFFVLGLILMPIGGYLRRRRLLARGELPSVYPKFDLHDPLLRRSISLVAIATAFNFIILSTASYKATQYMESVSFCGQTCHTVMQPEFTALLDSPHARVSCVECHIGPGASWFVRSKLSGLRQVYAVAFHTYHRPIPAPVKFLRPARETCEECHWPQRFDGDKVLVRTKFSDDEKNTPLTTVLVLKIGGHTWQGGIGIHGRHLDTRLPITYVATDDKRQVIPQITYPASDGKTVVFESTDIKVSPEELARGEHRTMDCMDCHNRPTHIFQLPEHAVDQAMSQGQISADLPFIKKKAVELLRADYPDRETAAEKIPSEITAFYRTSYPDAFAHHRAQVESAAEKVKTIYLRNIFPQMKISWGTYLNNLGHEDFLGCFRCHDGSHTSSDGQTIPNDCSTCHNLLAVDETNPKVLVDLGIQ